MARRRGRRRLAGLAEAKATLRALPKAIRDEVLASLDTSGETILKDMIGRTPKRTGALRAGLSKKVFERTLRLEIGLRGANAGRSKLFYGRIVDLGFGPKFPIVTRFHRGAGRRTKPYLLRMPGLPAKRFVTGRYTDARRELRKNLQGIVARAKQQLPGSFS